MNKPKRGDVIGGRIYGLRNLFVSVVQIDNTMVVLGRHRTREGAMVAVRKAYRLFPLGICAALSLKGNPLHDYKSGDFLDPHDIAWTYPKLPGSCSECCDNCVPNSLNYRCPILSGRPLCAAICSVRIETNP